MKLIKNLAAALLLASVLSVNASAGDQHGPGAVPPPPPPVTSSTDTTEKTEETQVTPLEESQELPSTDELWYEALFALLTLY